MSNITKPSLRDYASYGNDFTKFSEAVQKSDASDETKQRFSVIASQFKEAHKTANNNRGETYTDAHKAWQTNNAPGLVEATRNAANLLGNPAEARVIRDLVAQEKGPEIGRIRADKLASAAKDLLGKEDRGKERNPGWGANHPNPLPKPAAEPAA